MAHYLQSAIQTLSALQNPVQLRCKSGAAGGRTNSQIVSEEQAKDGFACVFAENAQGSKYPRQESNL